MIIGITTFRKDHCRIIINRGLLERAGEIIRKKSGARKLFIITDTNVKRLHFETLRKCLTKSQLEYDLISFPAGERSKSLATYNRIISQLLKKGADRRSILVTFGGGVTGDMAGFAAATYMRGIELIQIPTTLVGQIYSSIGGKVAIDSEMTKNLIGSFYSPSLIMIDPNLLSTLAERDFLNGFFEAIKIALVQSRPLYKFMKDNFTAIMRRDTRLLEQLIRRCIKEKAKIVTADPFDLNIRAILNFGHTLGHALESAGGYKQITHGEAVGRGMLVALRLSQVMEKLPCSRVLEASAIINSAFRQQRIKIPNPNRLWKIMTHDKKVENGRVRFILLKEIGKPVVRTVNKQLFIEALKMI